ncbi:MAG: glycosyltransferase [Gaiellaceae bacterium]
MRVAYACRDLASDSATGSGAHTFAAATAMAAVGHDVFLISAELARPWCDRLTGHERLSWRRVLPERAGHVYFTGHHSYADRLYDTIRTLHAQAPLDVVDVPDAGGEALTLLRAKRLLGQFPDTCLAVSLQPASTVRDARTDQPTSFAANLTAHAELYSRSHADIVLSSGAAGENGDGLLDGRLRRCLPGLPEPWPGPGEGASNAALTVVWLGAIRPGAGLMTALNAVALAREQEPCLRLVLLGADTPTDPLGRSYWEHLRGRLGEPLLGSVAFEGPPRVDQLGALPPAGSQCVLASGVSGTPLDALLAMRAGYLVIAPVGSVGAELIRDHETGRVVPELDPVALADILVAGVRQSKTGHRLGDAVARTVSRRFSPRRVGERLSEVYASAPKPPRAGSGVRRDAAVSVVIPLFNQGQFLPAALSSVRRSGLPDVDVVVVDDGSTDPHTVAVMEALTGVTSIRLPHRGLSAARNSGIRSARGSLVLVLDADDMIQPGFLPAAVDALRRREDLAFVGGYVRYFGLLDLVYVPAGPAGDINLVLHTHLKSAVLYRREALEQVGGYDESLPAFEDWEIQIRLARAGYDSDVLPLVGQLYRRHAKSMSFSTSNGMRSELIQYLVRKHAAALTKTQLVGLVQNLVDLWKTGYEPSRSVLLQSTGRTRPDHGPDDALISQGGNRAQMHPALMSGQRTPVQRQARGETMSASLETPLLPSPER